MNLNTLELQINGLSGPIPAALTNLGSLGILDLSGNPDLGCWESQGALTWAYSLGLYNGPDWACGICLPYLGIFPATP